MSYNWKVSALVIATALAVAVVALFFYSYTYVPGMRPQPLAPTPSTAMPPSMMGEGPSVGEPSAAQELLTMEGALAASQDYLRKVGDLDLAVAEIMEFSNHYYVDVYEQSTGIHAFELIIERDGDIYPEHGPNMMWNTKYGHHGGGMMGVGGMMGAYSMSAEMPIDEREALVYAQNYLNTYMPGAVAVEPHRFYGYYTLHVEIDGGIVGMLSVNGYSGDVWYHNWHGEFIRIMELQEHHEHED
ncbi:hypothetical protein [Candidatus Hecatella orcuttiae]|jgi:hypothetical protein|uniref:hypothetical protein n=1 Tax=Candidatus Hecatella orcuttiae TaxID=1935119 RepID=UPI002868275B|nr:hypothetical protein [Candidatus Hecatella orcuttiae]